MRNPTHNWELHYPLKSGDVFVEAGPWVGTYAYKASPIVGDDGLILLIEPYPMNIKKIRGVIEKFELSNVILVEKAVYNEQTTIGFSTHKNSTANRIQKKSELKVQADTLDNILSDYDIKNVDLLGADVEGAELNMVLGAEHYLSNHMIRNIAIAIYHDRGRYIKPVTEKLNEHNYKDIIIDDKPKVLYAHIP